MACKKYGYEGFVYSISKNITNKALQGKKTFEKAVGAVEGEHRY